MIFTSFILRIEIFIIGFGDRIGSHQEVYDLLNNFEPEKDFALSKRYSKCSQLSLLVNK